MYAACCMGAAKISYPPRLMGSWGAVGLGGEAQGALLDVLSALVVQQDDLQCMATTAAAGTSIGTRYMPSRSSRVYRASLAQLCGSLA